MYLTRPAHVVLVTWSPGGPGSVPKFGWAVFGGTDTLIRKLYDPGHVVGHWSQFDAVGQFPALEAPALLAADTREFFAKLR